MIILLTPPLSPPTPTPPPSSSSSSSLDFHFLPPKRIPERIPERIPSGMYRPEGPINGGGDVIGCGGDVTTPPLDLINTAEGLR